MAIGKLPDDDSGGDEGGNEGIFAEINITPLTDVFLVMVIIFMVSALAVQVEARKETQKVQDQAKVDKTSGLNIQLPQGQAHEINTKLDSLILVVPVNGDVHLGPKAIPDADIDNLFRAAYQRNKNTQVILNADKAVVHGRVVNLMERARAAGLAKIGIGTGG
jgi:biopolymer transport protein ExbD